MVTPHRKHSAGVPFTIRVGVTGHRSATFAESEELLSSVRRVLDLVSQLARELVEEDRELYDSESPVLRLISPLAAGADRVVAEEAIALGFKLQCPLPFSREEYAEDFPTPDLKEKLIELLGKADAILELDGKRAHSDEAYEAVGHTVLRQSDLLLAIWDGKEARGLGGTGQVVQEAFKLEIPVVRINPSFPEQIHWLGGEGRTNRPGDLVDLFDQLRKTFSVPASLTKRRGDRQALLGYHRRESRRAPYFGRYLDKLKGAADIRRRVKSAQQWCALWETSSSVSTKGNHADTAFRELFIWADGIAGRCASLYRKAWMANYLLGSVVVLAAFLAHDSFAPFWSWLELAFIATIFFTTFWGRYRRWHERWIDYRLLAEGLRQMQVLSLFSRVTPSFRVPVHMEQGDHRRSWAHWYLRAIVRHAGLPSGDFNGSHLVDSRAVVVRWSRSQVAYHGEKAERYGARHRLLHRIGSVLFVLAGLACLIHLVIPAGWHPGEAGDRTLKIAVLVFPAFGAAIGAILHQGEFEKVASRSYALAARLQDLVNQLANPARRTNSYEFGDAIEDVSEIMLAELSDFRYVFLDKPIVLPA